MPLTVVELPKGNTLISGYAMDPSGDSAVEESAAIIGDLKAAEEGKGEKFMPLFQLLPLMFFCPYFNSQ